MNDMAYGMYEVNLPDTDGLAASEFVVPETFSLVRFVSLCLQHSVVVAVANRQPRLLIVKKGDVGPNAAVAQAAVAQAVVSGETCQVMWGGTGTAYKAEVTAALTNGAVHIPMMPITLLGGDIIRVDALNAQAGDLMNFILLRLEVLALTADAPRFMD